MNKNIYVVFGTAGEYSDRREWPIIAHTDIEKARELVVNATKAAAELYAKHGEYDIPEGSNPYDPKMDTDYTGTSYFYHEVELID